jgi:hypothetical protein
VEPGEAKFTPEERKYSRIYSYGPYMTSGLAGDREAYLMNDHMRTRKKREMKPLKFDLPLYFLRKLCEDPLPYGF